MGLGGGFGLAGAGAGVLGWEEQEQPRACLNTKAAPAKGDIGGGLGPLSSHRKITESINIFTQ